MPVISLAGVNRPGDIVLPMARVLHTTAPGTTLNDIGELTYRLGGMAVMPKRAVAFRAANGDATLIPGLGVTEAAEIADMAYAIHERQALRQFETQDQRRERVGLPSIRQTLMNLSDAMENKADWFKRNPSQHQANFDPEERGLY